MIIGMKFKSERFTADTAQKVSNKNVAKELVK
jgi:hypothetical protein